MTRDTQMSARTALLATIAIWFVCSVVMCLNASDLITSFTFRDSDDALRLAEVRDWLAGQSWFDVSQYRIFPPHGVPMHWSRIVDIPLAGVMLIARQFTDPAKAELIAVILVPLLLLLVLFLTIHALTLRLTGRRAMAVMASVMLSLSMGIAIQFLPMRIDHHGWQILLGSLAALCALRSLTGGLLHAALAGLCMAASLAIAIEGLPYAVAIAGAFALLYLRGRAGRTDLALLLAYLTSLTASAVALLLVTRGVSGATILWCDALSPAYLPPMAAATATLLLGERMIGSHGVRHRLISLILAGAAGALVFALASPQCLAGPFAQLDPIVYRYWYLNIGEGRPAWTQPIDIAILVPLPGVVGLVGTLFALRFDAKERRDLWLFMLVLQIATFAVSLTVMRAMGIAHALALPGSAWMFMAAFSGAMRLALRPLRIVLGFSCFLLTPLGAEAMAYTLVVPRGNEQGDRMAAKFGCTAPDTLQAFDRLGPTLVFTPLDLGPDLLIYTRNSVVATGHHRNNAGMKAVITAFISAPDQARTIIAGTGAQYLAFCQAQREVDNYAHVNPHGLMAQLRKGTPPAWLQPVAMPKGDGLHVFRIAPR